MQQEHAGTAAQATVMGILVALSFSHLTNDMIQSLLPSIYPILKENFALNFRQIGLITLTYQLTASLLQPVVGMVTDRRPLRFSLPFGMLLSASGLVTLSLAANYPMLLFGAGLLGSGSSIFHPESSRMARAASGGRHGFAQSFFQIGGNAGTSLGPLLAAYIVLPHGQRSLIWFLAAAFLAAAILTKASNWYYTNHLHQPHQNRTGESEGGNGRHRVKTAPHRRGCGVDDAGILEIFLPRGDYELLHVLPYP